MTTLFGLKVVESQHLSNIPRMQLSPKVAEIIGYSKPEFVAEMNAWMLEFFGTEDRMYLIGETYYVSPKTAAMMRMRRESVNALWSE